MQCDWQDKFAVTTISGSKYKKFKFLKEYPLADNIWASELGA